MAAPAKKSRAVPAGALLTYAEQYHHAATLLFPVRQQVEAPLYFMYAHAIELALKAYLRTRNVTTNVNHSLSKLKELCEANGMQAGQHLRNVIELLESEHAKQGYRYFLAKSTVRPSPDYVRDVVDALVPTVAAQVRQQPTTDVDQTIVAKFIVGKPERRPK